MHLGGQTTIPNPQPGGRAPAPGDLALVQAFVNSNYDLERDHGRELLDSPSGLDDWLRRRHLVKKSEPATEDDLRRAIAVREGLRALLVSNHGASAPDPAAFEALTGTSVVVRLGPKGPSFGPATPTVEGALALILADAAAAMLDGTWPRLKACRECSWAFYDHSKNGAGSWCSMKVCGGRVKQRAHYRRSRRQS
jgi:predicted RNA-binding Zn ribbon-like protein